MTVYDGSGLGDPAFASSKYADSPRLRGAVNCAYAGFYHNDLRVDPRIVRGLRGSSPCGGTRGEIRVPETAGAWAGLVTRRRAVCVLLACVVLVFPAAARGASAPKPSFLHLRYGAVSSPFSRDYWVYLPTKRPVHAPVVVYLHGCVQGAVDAAVGTRWNQAAERYGFIAVYPNERVSQDAATNADGYANGTGCWNFFQPKSQVSGGR